VQLVLPVQLVRKDFKVCLEQLEQLAPKVQSVRKVPLD
jgi:hypothetical protein